MPNNYTPFIWRIYVKLRNAHSYKALYSGVLITTQIQLDASRIEKLGCYRFSIYSAVNFFQQLSLDQFVVQLRRRFFSSSLSTTIKEEIMSEFHYSCARSIFLSTNRNLIGLHNHVVFKIVIFLEGLCTIHKLSSTTNL